ncbi:unnamed protein product, partial [Allacma fusca]
IKYLTVPSNQRGTQIVSDQRGRKYGWSKEESDLKNQYLKTLFENILDSNKMEAKGDVDKSDPSRDLELNEFSELSLGEDSREQEDKTGNSSNCGKERNSADANLKVWEEVMEKTGGKKVDFPHFKAFRNRPLTDATAVFQHNAWDNVEWNEEMEAQAQDAISKNTKTVMEQEKVEALEKEADENWNKFYEIHQNKFFKDRNWLFTEFPELEGPFGCSVTQEEFEEGMRSKRMGESYTGENSKFKLLEVGCGAGNTVFPLLSANNNPELFVYCCDFSKTAVDIVKNHSQFEKDRCCPFVLDVTDENPVTPFPPGSLDAVIMIFVISAISPNKFDNAIRNVRNFLKPGGLVLLRDYGRYDLAQLRFRDGRCISDNFYMRGDGTRVYFFTPDELEELFKRNGFSKMDISVDRRLQVNRSKQLKMYRIWMLAKFSKCLLQS